MVNGTHRHGRFKSKAEALHMRVHVWTCQSCGGQHEKDKPMSCMLCGAGGFYHFDSKMEAARYATLAMLLRHERIEQLRLQVPFAIYNNGGGKLSNEKAGKPVFKYIADFVYKQDGAFVIEDVKGHDVYGQTDVFKLKKKIIEAAYQVEIKIV
jgi:hypothetical protein